MRRFRTVPTTAVVTTRAGSTRRSSPPPHRENATARQAPPDAGSEFRPLLRDIRERELLDRRPGWYARVMAANALGPAAVVTGVALVGDSWWVLLLTPVLAVLCGRTAFIGRGAGHTQISGNRAVNRRTGRERLVEGSLLTAHVAGYLTVLLTAMPPARALVFAALHQALFGLHLGMAFAPDHKGMDMPDPDGEKWGHLRRQVLTSRHIEGGVLTDWFLDGISHRIEHHLFPGIPRPHLKPARPLVKAHCRELGAPTRRPASSTPTAGPCGTCTKGENRCVPTYEEPTPRATPDAVAAHIGWCA